MESNVTPNISRSSDSFSSVPPIVNGAAGDGLCVPGDDHSLSLIRIQFHSTKVTPLTYPAEVTNHGICYCNSTDKVESSA